MAGHGIGRKSPGKGAGDRGVAGCGRRVKIAEKKKGEGAGDRGKNHRKKRKGKGRWGWGSGGCGGREEIAKNGEKAGWEMLAGEDNPEKDGKY